MELSADLRLRNLGDMANITRSRVEHDFSNSDTGLSAGFRKAYENNISSSGNKIRFSATTTTITTSAGLKIYLPNQWFVLASYAVDFAREIVQYRDLTESALTEHADEFKGPDGKVLERKEIYQALRSDGNTPLKELFTSIMSDYLKQHGQQEAVAETNCSMLYRFVTEIDWWLGGKGIERSNDFYVSPVLRVLNLVNVSQNYVATITYAYVTDDVLYRELPTMTNTQDDELKENDDSDEYHRAAKVITGYIEKTGFQFDATKEDINAIRNEFLSEYSPEKLSALSDEDILKTLFYSVDVHNDNLCYFLEFNPDSKKYFGSIAGGSAYKFGLFQKQNDGQWTTGSSKRPVKLTEAEALERGKKIRDYLVNGARVIEEATLETPADYEVLDDRLMEVTEKNCALAWMHKYFAMLYPDKFSAYHLPDWQKHVLYALRIKPSEKYYGRDGQISIIRRYAGLDYYFFFKAFYDKFGGIKTFCRLGTSDQDHNYAEELMHDKVVGIGWNDIGPLTDYVSGNSIDRKALTEALQSKCYTEPAQAGTASRKAGELATFFDSNTDTVFVMMEGERLIALVDEVGDYYFDESQSFGHRKPANWHVCFQTDEKLPNPSAGHMTACYELSDEANLMYLYDKYYYGLDGSGETQMKIIEPYIPPVYKTGLKIGYAMNRIIFGAPGTGKSYKLEQDRRTILQDGKVGDYERVTFHPEYSYSQFVGTYKPVSEGKEIYYKFVPGPFMRVYVEALKNGKTENPQPYILLIEEINRARVAAVFGDVFQLLDRDEDGVSQYEIQASEDIRKYLSDELGGEPDNYKKIMLPDNMFIWATMNSADQGVFPMDTAFKRRWNFEYLGINANEDKVNSEVDLVKGNQETHVSWNRLRKAINDKLAREYKVNEDKLLGPFFLSRRVIDADENNMMKNPEKFREAFKSKVIMYLYEDAAKQSRRQLFSTCGDDRAAKYSGVCEAFDEMGMGIFSGEFKENYYDKQKG